MSKKKNFLVFLSFENLMHNNSEYDEMTYLKENKMQRYKMK
jgi:hypothetical protein